MGFIEAGRTRFIFNAQVEPEKKGNGKLTARQQAIAEAAFLSGEELVRFTAPFKRLKEPTYKVGTVFVYAPTAYNTGARTGRYVLIAYEQVENHLYGIAVRLGPPRKKR